ncbi:MAG: hypothetical protein LUE99_08420 [Bacteroides sp.]|nr:hypothetical protein [Bacteroides sp.]
MYEDNTCGINVYGTLVMEGDAAITGNGAGNAVSLSGMNGSSLHLAGGFIKDNSGESLRLYYASFTSAAPTVTVDAALPAASAYLLTLDQYIKADDNIACETVVTGGNGYTLTADDLARFTLKHIRKQGSSGSDYIVPRRLRTLARRRRQRHQAARRQRHRPARHFFGRSGAAEAISGDRGYVRYSLSC